MKVTVALTDIAEALLQRVPGSSDAIRAATLWQSKPYIVICLRRPGCVGCRKIAQDYWKRREEIEGAGVGMAVIVNQTLPGEIEDFKEKIWGGDVFLDKEQAFYRAVGEGKVRRGSLWVRNLGENLYAQCISIYFVLSFVFPTFA